MLEKITDFFSGMWEAFIDFLLWLPIKIFDLFLGAIATVVEAIPAPDFVSSGSLGDYINEDILWMCNQAGVGESLAIFASAILFYFLRRLLTLGIW